MTDEAPVGRVRLRLILEDDKGKIAETEVEVNDGEEQHMLEIRVVRALPKILSYEDEPVRSSKKPPITFGDK